jgi:hypothetical protein
VFDSALRHGYANKVAKCDDGWTNYAVRLAIGIRVYAWMARQLVRIEEQMSDWLVLVKSGQDAGGSSDYNFIVNEMDLLHCDQGASFVSENNAGDLRRDLIHTSGDFSARRTKRRLCLRGFHSCGKNAKQSLFMLAYKVLTSIYM